MLEIYIWRFESPMLYIRNKISKHAQLVELRPHKFKNMYIFKYVQKYSWQIKLLLMLYFIVIYGQWCLILSPHKPCCNDVFNGAVEMNQYYMNTAL